MAPRPSLHCIARHCIVFHCIARHCIALWPPRALANPSHIISQDLNHPSSSPPLRKSKRGILSQCKTYRECKRAPCFYYPFFHCLDSFRNFHGAMRLINISTYPLKDSHLWTKQNLISLAWTFWNIQTIWLAEPQIKCQDNIHTFCTIKKTLSKYL